MSCNRRLAPLILIVALSALAAPAAAEAEPPYCFDGSFQVAPGEAVQLTDPGFEPCGDPDGDAYTIELFTPPTYGVLAGDDGFVYTAPANFRGRDSFTYGAVDVNGERSEPALVAIAIGRPPTCTDATLRVAAGARLPIEFPCEADGAGIAFASIFMPPHHGALQMSPDGRTATYFPKPGYAGPDEILFQPYDELGFSSTTVYKLAITVVAPRPPRPPVPPPGPPANELLLSDLAADESLRAARRRGLRLEFRAARAGTADVRLTMTRRAARRLGLRPGRSGRVTVGRRRISVAPGANAVRIGFTRRARRAMTRARRVVVSVDLTLRDDLGNRATEQLVVTLRR